ncbi:MAG TPA: hypothetical protein DD452_00990, partial [Nitrospina sp.]|nr:hypothetical protein [Nitrospina sp.]
RRPSHTSKREEGTPVDNATPEPKDKTTLENNEFSKDNSSGDINSPMPPMPRPFIREGQNLSGEQPPVSNEPASPADGTTGD